MNRVALIDGATLTAARRVLGLVKINNLENIDAEIAAFEGLLQAILFFDEVCCIDDFEQASRRDGIDNLQCVTFLDKSDVNYSQAWESARTTTGKIGLRIADGQVDTSDFQSTLDQIRTHLEFDFAARSSSTRLLVRAIAEVGGISPEKHGNLLSVIAHQFRKETSKSFTDFVQAFKSGEVSSIRHPLAQCRDLQLDTSLVELAGSLNWLAMKTVFYVETANDLGCDVVLHPVRHAFLVQHILRPAMECMPIYHAVTEFLNVGVNDTVREIINSTDLAILDMKLPMWCAFLATQTKKPEEFIPLCQHLREERLFVEARRQLDEFRRLDDEMKLGQFHTYTKELRRELTEVSSRLLSKYGVTSHQGLSLAPLASVALRATGHAMVASSLSNLPLPRKLIGASDTRGFRGILRSVVTDLVSIERLGALHEVITSNVRTFAKKKRHRA